MRMAFAFIAAVILGLSTNPVRAQQGTSPAVSRVLPIAPAELLRLLPAPPAGWKMTTSMATNQVSSWLITMAQRQFESSQPAAGGPQNGQPSRTTILLVDTGFDASVAGAFADFRPTASVGLTKFVYLNCPAIRRQSSSSTDSIQLLIANRFLLTVEVENQQKDAVLGWIQRVPLDRYRIPSGGVLSNLPPTVVIKTVDELNPTNNSESTTTIGAHVPVPR